MPLVCSAHSSGQPDPRMLILVPALLALLAATALMSLAWLRSRQEGGKAGSVSQPAADPHQAASKNVDKLRDFHGLAKVNIFEKNTRHACLPAYSECVAQLSADL